MCTSTPLRMFSSNTHPPILLPSMDFCSALSNIPNIPELPNIPAKKGVLRKRVYHCITLLCLISCLSLLIFISLNISGYISFSGALESNLNLPAVGSLNLSVKTEEVLNFTSKVSTALSSTLSKMGSEETPSQLWDQVYMNIKPSSGVHR